MRKLLFGLLAWLAFAAAASAQVIAPNISASPVISASSGAVSAGVTTATLAAPAAGYWEITQLEITGNTATAAANIPCTVTGLEGGTMTYSVVVNVIPTATTATPPIQTVNFNGGLSGNPGTAVVFSCPSFGAGNVGAAIAIHGMLVH